MRARTLGIPLALAFAAAAALSAATFTVTSTADSGAGTLRQAINDANDAGGADTIAFNIAGGGPHTIALATPLPTITFARHDRRIHADRRAREHATPSVRGLNTVLKWS